MVVVLVCLPLSECVEIRPVFFNHSEISPGKRFFHSSAYFVASHSTPAYKLLLKRITWARTILHPQLPCYLVTYTLIHDLSYDYNVLLVFGSVEFVWYLVSSGVSTGCMLFFWEYVGFTLQTSHFIMLDFPTTYWEMLWLEGDFWQKVPWRQYKQFSQHFNSLTVFSFKAKCFFFCLNFLKHVTWVFCLLWREKKGCLWFLGRPLLKMHSEIHISQ